jgi:hypothetical protein
MVMATVSDAIAVGIGGFFWWGFAHLIVRLGLDRTPSKEAEDKYEAETRRIYI